MRYLLHRLLLLPLAIAVLAGLPAAANAVTPGVAWSVQAPAEPTSFQASDSNDLYKISLTNVGSQESSGTITVTDTLPAGITTSATPGDHEHGVFTCSPGAGQTVVTCTSEQPVPAQAQPWGVGNTRTAIFIPVSVSNGASGTLTNQVQVSGGGASSTVSASTPTPIGSATLPFGLLDFTASAFDASGALDTQAGDHPASLYTAFDTPGANITILSGISAYPVEQVRQVVVDLPAGLIGNPRAAPACTEAALTNFGSCPAATQVGEIALLASMVGGNGGAETNVPIYNVVPERGYPAEFGLYDSSASSLAGERPVFLFAGVVGSGAGTHLRVTSAPIPQALPLLGNSIVFYGNPAVKDKSPTSPIAFFSNPANCSAGGSTTTIHVDSWENPGRLNPDGTPDFSDPNWKSATSTSPPVTGCDRLQFNPSITVQPDTSSAGSPAGLNVDLKIPQSGLANPFGLITPELKDATVVLPQGVSVNPATADGLQGCSDAQLGLSTNAPPACPLASQIGTVQIHTPLLAELLQGQIYLGTPGCSPCGNADAASGRMVRLFIVVNDPQTGVVVKLPGTVAVDPQTAQLTASFLSNPQLPFDDLKLAFKGGPRGALATPRTCGTFTTMSDLRPWSAPQSGPDATSSDSFTISSGPNGTPCVSDPSQLPFAPVFTAGTTNNLGGAFSPFTLSFSRQDSDQQFSGVSVTLPPGLLAMLPGVPLCSDANANAGTCPAASRVGSVTAGAGPGRQPFFLPGQVYLTGPYNGGPFGLVVEVPAVAGPFNLGTVVVRQSLRVDPHTAQASVVSDPFPTILDGIPLQIRTVRVTVDREGFTFNPTSCDPMSVGGTLTSTQGAHAAVSSHFQAANCANLPFHPVFTVLTQAKTNKQNGASLTVKTSFPKGPQANIRSVAVVLPKQLPSRLTTIQQACPEAVFAVNPAGCPAGSVIGTGTATTPVLASPLTGPAYLVSHGGAAFPDVVIVFQGEGVTLDLVGSVNIRHGITSSTFAAVPDAPISAFELTLPEGPHSALTANLPAKARGNLCGQTLTMPFTITGQNGVQIVQNTRIKVSGCPKAKKAKKKHKGKRGKRARKGSLKRGK